MKKLIVLASFFFAAGPSWSQEPQPQPDRATVPFSDPARPKTLRASLINGSITVKGYDGKEAIVEAVPGSNQRRRSERPERPEQRGSSRPRDAAAQRGWMAGVEQPLLRAPSGQHLIRHSGRHSRAVGGMSGIRRSPGRQR